MKLGVVIPAYKDTYFERTLASLAAQTNPFFTVYIGDDHSPANLSAIVDRFRDRLQIKYTRFPVNIGARQLVRQWERCMSLLHDEDWVWFFSDDDLASPNCVETFFRYQARSDGEVYRFNTRTINEEDVEVFPTVRGPDFETSEQMAYNLLLGKRGNSMPDHVFSREVYRRKGGFVYTPYAQAADWGTSILFSQDKGMRIMQEATVSWRKAGASISANVAKNRRETILGHYAFIKWMLNHFKYLREQPSPPNITYEAMRDAAQKNLQSVIIYHYKGLPPSLYPRHLRFLIHYFQRTPAEASKDLAVIMVKRLRNSRYEKRMERDERAKKAALAEV